MKVVGPLHKSDVKGVILNVISKKEINAVDVRIRIEKKLNC